MRGVQDWKSSDRAALLFSIVWFKMQFYTVAEAERVLAGVTDIIHSRVRGLRACGWRWRRNAVEITTYLSLPSPSAFFSARVWVLNLPHSKLSLVIQGCEAWNRLAGMRTPDSVALEGADGLKKQFIWLGFTSASPLWNSGLQKTQRHVTCCSKHNYN